MPKGEICWVIGDNTYELTGDALIAVLLEIAERLESIKILLAKAGNSEIEESGWSKRIENNWTGDKNPCYPDEVEAVK